MTGSSTQGIQTVLHPVSDLAKAKEVYATLLGVPPTTDTPYYVGFEAAGQQIGLVPGGGPQSMTSPVAYWHVPDIEASCGEGYHLKRRARLCDAWVERNVTAYLAQHCMDIGKPEPRPSLGQT